MHSQHSATASSSCQIHSCVETLSSDCCNSASGVTQFWHFASEVIFELHWPTSGTDLSNAFLAQLPDAAMLISLRQNQQWLHDLAAACCVHQQERAIPNQQAILMQPGRDLVPTAIIADTLPAYVLHQP